VPDASGEIHLCVSCPEIGLQVKWDKMGQEKRKKEAIEEYLRGGVTLREVGSKYGLSASSLHRWIKGLESGETVRKRQRREVIEEMPKDVRVLQRELYEARLKAKLFEAMIDIAEDEMGVVIRKKRGAKR